MALHTMVLWEGYTDGFQRMKADLNQRKYVTPKGVPCHPQVREVKLLDIVVLEDIYDQFQADMQPVFDQMPNAEKWKREKTKSDGIFRWSSMIKWINRLLKLAGVGLVPYERYKGETTDYFRKLAGKNSWAGHLIPIGTCKDHFMDRGDKKDVEMI